MTYRPSVGKMLQLAGGAGMDLSSPSEGSIFDLCLDPAEGEKEEGHRLGKASIPKKLARRQEFNPDRYNVFTPVSCSSIYKNGHKSRQVEDALGVMLFDHSKHRVVPT